MEQVKIEILHNNQVTKLFLVQKFPILLGIYTC
ncbi:uncharacterized protein METZ01_LOCUS346103 [marine metagenome]|uniref:Uncharacterized protein n=1 Tax=marine metagenome TaxID=408172 RepID=A0A382R6A3_9ZZZZ